MHFEPIAIVGQACLLPGATTPDQLWRLVLDVETAIGACPDGRWGVPKQTIVTASSTDTRDQSISDRGGYVDGFQAVFDPHGFDIPTSEIETLDPVFQWLLHVGREALRDARYAGDLARAGAVVGNLSYPSTSLARFAERTWLADQPLPFPSQLAIQLLNLPDVDPRNRFMSGLPAHILARALGLGAGAFALDAACASSLYAIKLACDWLHQGRADLMIAGAVNCADDLFIHVGFTALGALSPSGQSRPFDADADGLVPAEGAALVALRRLDDAERDGDHILGVIRGIGLSNDGRGHGFLVPSQEGQVRALRAAYQAAGLTPADISLVECHATGTSVGDAVEIRTLAQVFGERTTPLPIGSLKANLGHLITAAGAAGLLKVLAALREGILPPMPGPNRPNAALEGTSLRPVRVAEEWPGSHPRRAGVSAFGFGGNNAHLIVEEAPPRVVARHNHRGHLPPQWPTVAIISMGALVADGASTADFAASLFLGRSRIDAGVARANTIRVPLKQLRFPPRDLEATLPQQLLVFAAAHQAIRLTSPLPAERTGVFVGMQCDAEICRHGARWRAAGWSDVLGATDSWTPAARDNFVPALGAAGVVGAMPNIVANRLNSQFDLGGPSLTVSAEELSGVRALEIARGALERGEIDAALVGAVDLAAEPVTMAALATVAPLRRARGGDAAVVLVLKRLDDARRDGDRVLAVLADEAATDDLRLGDGADAISLEPLFGHAHAAIGLLAVAAGALCCAYGARPAQLGAGSVSAWSTPGTRRVAARTQALGGQTSTVRLQESPATGADHSLEDLQRLLDESRADGQAEPVESLTFAAHPPPPRLPPLWLPVHTAIPPQDSAAPGQMMPAAPRLPAVDLDASSSVRDRHALALRGPDQVTPAAVLRQPIALDPIAARHADYHRQLASNQQEFQAAQSAVHREFLDARERAIGLLLRMRTSQPPSPKPALPTRFSRSDLEVHASGRISDIFGPLFAGQDGHTLQVRMPEPPLLLADRVVGLDAAPGSMGLGTVWTETDVVADGWYLNRGFMPAGIMIEAGQADLFLISYLGVDALNKGQRAYRLLGCDLTYHGSLPQPGETLRYEIHVDGHANQADVRLFFFHYDCTIGGRPALTVRRGQAGFFSQDELDQSAGVVWSPETQEIRSDGRVDPPAVTCTRREFSRAEIEAFARGDLYGCFGAGFELAQTHVRSPAIQDGRMLLFDRVSELDPRGGPWGRGYLKTSLSIHPDDWFFAGHFKNDPCMPGTLMFEGCLQAMSFYLAALGYALDKDGWRFAPVAEEQYRLQCRGQVTPVSKELVCELFVEEVHAGPLPTVYADLVGTVDGLKAFHARRVGLHLTPDWPLSTRADIELADFVPSPVQDGFRFDYRSLLACAWGKPSAAFGSMYEVFDGDRRVARLPGPPYHFMSRVVQIDAAMGEPKSGGRIEIEYDVPADAWYFNQNGCTSMPFCVLLETVLQPCGWLASYVGSALMEDEDLSFRNLDGIGRVLAEIQPGTRTLRTSTTLTSVSHSGGMILESFEVKCWAGDTLVYELETGFGFFPKAALDNQVGLPTSPELRRLHDEPSDYLVDLTARPARFFEGDLRLPGPMLLMIDRVTAFDPSGGRAGLGFLRAEKRVDPAEWFFKAHFFQDPVQPGSLGIEAMIQLLQYYMLEAGLATGADQHFEPIALGRSMIWKYRGQVIPRNERITITLEVTEAGREPGGAYAVAVASLWVDGKRIYEASGLGMRVVPNAGAVRRRDAWLSQTPAVFLPEVSAFWGNWFGKLVPLVDDVCRGLVDRFVGQVAFEDRDALTAACQSPVLFIGNHQCFVESTVFAIVASAWMGEPLLTLARIENQIHWLDLLMRHAFSHPDLRDPRTSTYFDRQKPDSLLGILDALADEMTHNRRSVMVHVEGGRARSCRRPVRKMSGTFVELAIRLNCPIVPVRFTGGLPAEPLSSGLEFPVGMGRQDIFIGRPLLPDELRSLAYRELGERVMAAINRIGPPNEVEMPRSPQPAFETAAYAWMSETGASLGHAVLMRILEGLADPSAATRRIVEAARSGVLYVGTSQEERWLAEFARRLFGERGPRIRVQ